MHGVVTAHIAKLPPGVILQFYYGYVKVRGSPRLERVRLCTNYHNYDIKMSENVIRGHPCVSVMIAYNRTNAENLT